MRRSAPLGIATLVVVLLLATFQTRGQAKPPEAAPSCGQRGRVALGEDAVLTDGSGRKLLRFSGGESAVTFIGPPSGGSDLAQIETGTGRGSFRVSGFIKATELPIYASVGLPIVNGRLWLSSGTRVTAAGSSGGKVRVEKQLSHPFAQRFTAMTDCTSLTFAPPSPVVEAIPSNARVYLMKVAQLDLYEEVPPTGSPIATLQRSRLQDSVVFYGTEARGGFVHVHYRGEVNVDAWAKAGDLQARPRGEASDTTPSRYWLSSSPPSLALAKLPRVVLTTRELPLRLAARDAEPPIGVIEADTEVYVMDTVASWAKVLPKSLHVLPVDDLSFWVRSSDLVN